MALRGTAVLAQTTASSSGIITVSGIGIQNGDIVILQASVDKTSVTFTFPSGFSSNFGGTTLSTQQVASGEGTSTVGIAWKLANNEGTTYTVSGATGSNLWTITARVYSGRNQTTPFAVAPTQRGPIASASEPITATCTALTCNAGDDLVLFVPCGAVLGTDTQAYTVPSGFANKVVNSAAVTFSVLQDSCDFVNHSASTSGTAAGTLSGSSVSMGYGAYLISIAQAAASGVIPYDAPNPAQLPQNVELRSWIRAPLPTPQAIPPAQYDWPNPVLAKPNYDLRGWIEAPQPSPQAIPFLQRDWPNPALWRRSIDALTWIQDPIPVPQAIPPRQSDWPNPLQPRRSIDWLIWSWSFPPTQAVTPPFAQYDWPNPILGKPNFDLRGWIQAPIPSPQPIPFLQFDWPNPRGPQRPVQDWVQAPQPAPNPIAFLQFDWPNPRGWPRSIDALTWTQSVISTPVAAIPIAQYDWPNPRIAVPRVTQDWIFSGQLPVKPVAPTGLHEVNLGFNLFRLGGRVGGN